MLSAGKRRVIPVSMLETMKKKRKSLLDAVKCELIDVDSLPISAEAKKAIRSAR